jgi:hypothetical protein
MEVVGTVTYFTIVPHRLVFPSAILTIAASHYIICHLKGSKDK